MNRYIWILLLSALITAILTGCVKLRGFEDLGDGYYFFLDGQFSDIIYSTDKKRGRNGSGIEIIPFKVIKYKPVGDSIYVINEEIENGDRRFNYWIIDKSIKIDLSLCNDEKSCRDLIRSNISGPLDSITFYNSLQQTINW